RLFAASDGILVWRRKDFGRHLVAHRLENLQFLTFRQSGGHELWNAIEIAVVAMILPVREQPVGGLPIICIIEGTADPDIDEQRAAHVERKTLHSSRTRIREVLLDDALFGDRREIIRCRPLLAAALRKPVELIRLERLASDGIITKELV